jgi:hypothetical protein
MYRSFPESGFPPFRIWYGQFVYWKVCPYLVRIWSVQSLQQLNVRIFLKKPVVRTNCPYFASQKPVFVKSIRKAYPKYRIVTVTIVTICDSVLWWQKTVKIWLVLESFKSLVLASSFFFAFCDGQLLYYKNITLWKSQMWPFVTKDGQKVLYDLVYFYTSLAYSIDLLTYLYTLMEKIYDNFVRL